MHQHCSSLGCHLLLDLAKETQPTTERPVAAECASKATFWESVHTCTVFMCQFGCLEMSDIKNRD